MFKEHSSLEKLLNLGRKLIPRWLFKAAQPIYHWLLVWAGALLYRFPSRGMKVIGITGTKGKSTTTFLTAKILATAGQPVAAIGSLGYKIRDREWPNTLKMTMPGRMRIQQFLREAKNAGCKYVVLEVTSEGIKQKRHLGIKFDAAVLTTIHREHIENHGTYENYIRAKQKLFRATKHTHILNADDPLAERFQKIPSEKTLLYSAADWERLGLATDLPGDFNKYNILAAATVAENYHIASEVIRQAVAEVKSVPGRMEFVDCGQSFRVVVDYAHTPDSLALVYDYLKRQLKPRKTSPRGERGRLIAILGAAGGGRDKWKRPEFGKIAAHYCDQIILTNEDPYDEDPGQILSEVKFGILNSKFQISNLLEIMDRREAIKQAVTLAQPGDIVVITGKGSETSMALADGVKIPWSDRQVVTDALTTLIPKSDV